MTDWLLAAMGLALAVWCLAPQQLPVSLYKLSLVALAAVVGYWIDRSLFPYARPDFFLDQGTAFEDAVELDPALQDQDAVVLQCTADPALLRLASAAMLRRAIIVGCAMLAMGLGA